MSTAGCQSAYNKDRLYNGLTALSFAIPVGRFASLGFKVFEGKIASKATPAANEANAAKKAKEIAQGLDGEMVGANKLPNRFNGGTDLPKGWTETTHNGFTHVRDSNGNIRVRIDPADAKTYILINTYMIKQETH